MLELIAAFVKMNEKKNKQEKFHESLLKILYPPPPSPPSPKTDSDEDKHNKLFLETLHNISDELENEETNPSKPNNQEEENDKLTRAQRKRLRKKKLKESASQRRKIIGPLLAGDQGNVVIPETVRQNDLMGTNATTESSGEMKQSKIKQRRKSKKLATEELLETSNIKLKN